MNIRAKSNSEASIMSPHFPAYSRPAPHFPDLLRISIPSVLPQCPAVTETIHQPIGVLTLVLSSLDQDLVLTFMRPGLGDDLTEGMAEKGGYISYSIFTRIFILLYY